PSGLEQLPRREPEVAEVAVRDGEVDAGAGGEPAPLIELAVVRQMDLGDRAADPAAVKDERRVVDPAVGGLERRADEDRERQAGRLAGEIGDSLPRCGQ